MFVMSNVLQGLATVLDTVLWLYMWVIIARALISWVNPDPWNPIVQFLERVTEPVLSPPLHAGRRDGGDRWTILQPGWGY